MLYRVTTKEGEVLEISAKSMKAAAKVAEDAGKQVAMVTKAKPCS